VTFARLGNFTQDQVLKFAATALPGSSRRTLAARVATCVHLGTFQNRAAMRAVFVQREGLEPRPTVAKSATQGDFKPKRARCTASRARRERTKRTGAKHSARLVLREHTRTKLVKQTVSIARREATRQSHIRRLALLVIRASSQTRREVLSAASVRWAHRKHRKDPPAATCVLRGLSSQVLELDLAPNARQGNTKEVQGQRAVVKIAQRGLIRRVSGRHLVKYAQSARTRPR
jgi:hypothetical protein